MDTDGHGYSLFPTKPAFRRSGVSAERRRHLDIEGLGFLPKAATFHFSSVFIRVHPWLNCSGIPFLNFSPLRVDSSPPRYELQNLSTRGIAVAIAHARH
jgi:hypothetical protein